MGDGADLALSEMLDYEEKKHEFHVGNLSHQEAYDAGIIDELGREIEESRMPVITDPNKEVVTKTQLIKQLADWARAREKRGLDATPLYKSILFLTECEREHGKQAE